MQKVGNGLSDNGFTNENLIFVKNIFEVKNFECKLYDLNEEIKELEETGIFDISKASILVIKNGVSLFTNPTILFNNLINLDWDKKYWDTRRQKVLNKRTPL